MAGIAPRTLASTCSTTSPRVTVAVAGLAASASHGDTRGNRQRRRPTAARSPQPATAGGSATSWSSHQRRDTAHGQQLSGRATMDRLDPAAARRSDDAALSQPQSLWSADQHAAVDVRRNRHDRAVGGYRRAGRRPGAAPGAADPGAPSTGRGPSDALAAILPGARSRHETCDPVLAPRPGIEYRRCGR